MEALIVLPAADPAAVRTAAGLHPQGSWYSPRQKRPVVFARLQGNPEGDPRERETR